MLAWFSVRAAGHRDRITLAAAVAIAFLGPIYLFAAVIRNTGFGLQGPDYVPIIATLPLLAFELSAAIHQSSESSRDCSRRWVAVVLAAALALAACSARSSPAQPRYRPRP